MNIDINEYDDDRTDRTRIDRASRPPKQNSVSTQARYSRTRGKHAKSYNGVHRRRNKRIAF